MTKVKNSKLKNPLEKYFSAMTRYHYYAFFLIFLSKFFVFWHVLNLIFLTPPMTYNCDSHNEQLLNNTNVCPCDDPIWDTSVFSSTVQIKFNTLCEKNWLISFSGSMFYVGLLIGSLVFGFLSDRFGRLKTFSICCLILAVAGCLVSVMPDIISFIILRMVEGTGCGGAIVTGYVLVVEYCGVRHRETISALYHIPINLGHATMSGISYLLRDCDEFQLAVSIPLFFFVALRWLLMESPKWLLDNSHCEEAVIIMEKFCLFNKTTTETVRAEIEEYHQNHLTKTGNRMHFHQIFRHKKLTINLLCMSVIYFICGMGYYGVSQYIGKMSGDIHINVAISGFLLLPGTIASIFLLKLLKRKPFLMATNFLSGLFMIIVICIPANHHWIRVIFACICNCFFFLSFIIVFLYGVELFPTAVRNSALGFLSFLSRLGMIVAPPINDLSSDIAGAIFGSLAILGAILCLPLPETKNAELPSSLEDSKTLSKKKANLGDDSPSQNAGPSQNPDDETLNL